MEKTCSKCNKRFKLINQELEFYEKISVPLPDNCPECRHQLRLETRNDRKFYKYPCAKCGVEMVTTVDPQKQKTVYCLNCYQAFRANIDLTKTQA